MIYTLYSYKGGVGRTMALANVAELFYNTGCKVLMIDWDLESPGLERYFPIESNKVLDTPGVIDMLLDYKHKMDEQLITADQLESVLFDLLDKYIITIYSNQDNHPHNTGKLDLISSGRRNDFSHYLHNVRTFNWEDFYRIYMGAGYFDLLRRQFQKKKYDVVLIDSRSGIAEMGGVCTYQLADTIIMFCAPNRQNLDGTYRMVQDFTNLKAHKPNLLIVPSRIENAEHDLLDKFKNDFFEKYNGPQKLDRVIRCQVHGI